MKKIWGILLVAAPVLLVASCAEGNSTTDRQAQTLADAISYPRQSSAEGFGRAALSTNLGRTPAFSVLEARDVPAAEPKDVSAHLVFRIHYEGSESGWTKTDPVTACYSVDFNYYGVVGTADRTTCPENAVALTWPPAPPAPEVPGTFDEPLKAILTGLPANPTQPGAADALAKGMPALQPDPDTNLTGPPPAVSVAVRGTDVGVSYRAGDSTSGIDCLLGSRLQGNVLVWRPSWIQVQPGELTCDPETALSRQGVKPPH